MLVLSRRSVPSNGHANRPSRRKLTTAEFSETVSHLRRCGSKRNHFHETIGERRVRHEREKRDRIAERVQRTQELLDSGDTEELLKYSEPLIHYHVSRLRVKFEFDHATSEDLVQAGRIGLWEAIESFDESKGAVFNSHATTCVLRRVWRELNTSKRQSRLGIRSYGGEALERFGNDRPEMLEQMADTELIGVALRKLGELPLDARLILQRCCIEKETQTTVARELGVCGALVNRKLCWALNEMKDLIVPLLVGAWMPFPYLVSDAWADLHSAQEKYSQPRDPSEFHNCKECGSDLPSKKADFCDKNCSTRFRYKRNRLAKKPR